MNPVDQNIENLFKNLQEETSFADASRNACEEASKAQLNGVTKPLGPKALQDNTREELITLAESGKIKYTVNYIKKASHAALGKIKADYEKKHLDETNDYVANNILSSITKLLKYFDLVKNTGELEEDLKKNYLLKRDVKNIVGIITPSIPYVGLLCGGVTVGKHVALNTLNEEPIKSPLKEVNTNGK